MVLVGAGGFALFGRSNESALQSLAVGTWGCTAEDDFGTSTFEATINADGTGILVQHDYPQEDTFTWQVDEGQLELLITANGNTTAAVRGPLQGFTDSGTFLSTVDGSPQWLVKLDAHDERRVTLQFKDGDEGQSGGPVEFTTSCEKQ